MKISGITNIGNRRSENQDKYVAGRLLCGVAFGFVCDGMGGVNGGAIASDTLSKMLEDGLFLHNEEPNFNEERAVLGAIEDANSAIYSMGLSKPALKGMGTTVAGVTVKNRECIVYHAGDSRVYILRNGRLALVTQDHSVVQELVNQSKISQEEAQAHPQKNLITRAVGVQENVDIDVASVDVCEGDIILCATDGLTNFISTQQLTEILSGDNVFGMPQKLIDKALENKATDNITAVVLAV
ncbi:MAG: Stp1/IreP family PP2C-type Ser/Thr phosphatase [Oscillospiraceae bacterium]